MYKTASKYKDPKTIIQNRKDYGAKGVSFGGGRSRRSLWHPKKYPCKHIPVEQYLAEKAAKEAKSQS